MLKLQRRLKHYIAYLDNKILYFQTSGLHVFDDKCKVPLKVIQTAVKEF